MGAKRILIVSYTFPPYHGVGGRRWAKFAKYLKKAGHHIQVISAISGTQKNSPWTNDVNEIPVTFIPSGYPEILSHSPNSIWQKVKYRFWLFVVKNVTKGNYYDRAIFMQKRIQKAVSSELQRGYDHIYVTCAPFHLAFHLVLVMEQFPKVKWSVDFRDPWTTNETSYGFPLLSRKRKRFEKLAERLVVRSFDEVISVAEPMTEYFQTLDPKYPEKFKTILNGFDPEDFPESPKRRKDPNQIKLIFAGSLYSKAKQAYDVFVKAINHIKKTDPPLYQKLHISFIGTEPRKLSALKHPNLEVLPYMPFEAIRKKLVEADFGLLFLTPDLDWSFSSKFTDYVGARLPIIVFSEKESKTGVYCQNQKIGWSINHINNNQFKDVIKRNRISENNYSEGVHFSFNLCNMVQKIAE